MKTISREQALQWIAQGESQKCEERMAEVNRRLHDLVLYVREHSPYFRDAYKDLGEAFILQDLPVTTKAGLLECYDHWVTDPKVTEESVRTYLSDLENVSENYLGRYTALSTSGTTGNPMPMVRDEYHNTIHGCLMEQRLLKGIEASLLSSKVASIIATDGFVSSYSSALRIKRRLGDRSDRFLILSVLTPTTEIVEKLNVFQPEMLTGYPSVLEVLAREKLAGRLSITPDVIASSAEKMTRDTYETLRNAFDCPILDNYCSTEGGEIAMSCSHGYLHLNEDWIILEPVDEEFRPVQLGEWSSGVLITDLTNFVQPIIRYHVGDCVRFSGQPCACGSNLPVLEISGRMGDMLSLNDTSVAFPVLYFMLSDVKNLSSWQIVQTGGNAITFRFIEKHGTSREPVGIAACEKLQQSLRSYGCGEVVVTISHEPFIKNPKGGKTPYVLNRSQ
ncbi:MAG: hypothetical protein LBV40_08150 [Methanomicrobiales archaeon]|jgi:phenylacetate-coenzyme A ligase PaaK-like adenylate-forming protein|nr:hypothetical protein [Methanomicrobiales archaeon]